jgi:site-specific DNA-methyltransferase (adenine-specific)
VTSPPYFGLRDYGVEGQIGLEATPDEFVAKMVAVFREVKRVLKDDGVLFLNIGDSYNAHPGQRKITDLAGLKQMTNAGSSGAPSRSVPTLKPKDLVGIPWMTAFALRADGWYLRQEIIWNKPNPMPESVKDRCTKSHEHIFLLTKSARYYFDADAIAETALESARSFNGGHSGNKDRQDNGRQNRMAIEVRNKRSVWTIATQPYSEAHFATFPQELPEICIKAGSRIGDTILDPFGGAGTTGLVADKLGRNAVLIELNPEYAAMAEKRIFTSAPLFAEVVNSNSEQMTLLESDP